MNHPDQSVVPPQAAPTSKRRQRVISACWIVFLAIVILTGLMSGLLGVIRVQGVLFPLNSEIREGCLRDPSLVNPQTPCPKQAEAILRYPDGRTVVIRGTSQEVQQRTDRAVDKVVAAQRRQGVGYLLVATLLVGGASAAIAWTVIRGWPRRSRRLDRPGGKTTSSPTG